MIVQTKNLGKFDRGNATQGNFLTKARQGKGPGHELDNKGMGKGMVLAGGLGQDMNRDSEACILVLAKAKIKSSD